jgi:hypothetical protein
VNPDTNVVAGWSWRKHLAFGYGEIFVKGAPDPEMGIVNGVSVSSNTKYWKKYNETEELVTVPGATAADRDQALGEMGRYVIDVDGHPDPPLLDAEIPQILKFMEWLDTNPNETAVLRIFVSHPLQRGPCPSCKNVIRWFNQQSRFSDRARVETISQKGEWFYGMDEAPVVRPPVP